MSINITESIRPDIIFHWNTDKLLGIRPRCDCLRIENCDVEPVRNRMMSATVTLGAYRDGNEDSVYETIFMTSLPSDALQKYEDIRPLLYSLLEYMIIQRVDGTISAEQILGTIQTDDKAFLQNLILDFGDKEAQLEQWKEASAKDRSYPDSDGEKSDAQKRQAASVEKLGEALDDGVMERLDDSIKEEKIEANRAPSKYGPETVFDIPDNDPVGITVCVPTYNVSQYLTRTLDSIRKQSHKDFRVIIRDDRSSDDTLTKIRDYIERHQLAWTLIEGEENVGVNLSRGLLMEAAKTSHVLFVDDDDYFTRPDAILILSEYLERDLIAFHIESPRILRLENTTSGPLADRPIIESLISMKFIGRPSFVYRRSFFSGFAWYRYHNYTEDYYMTLSYLLKEPTEHICTDVLYHWSDRYGSLSSPGREAKNQESLHFYRKAVRDHISESKWYKNNPDLAVSLVRGRL